MRKITLFAMGFGLMTAVLVYLAEGIFWSAFAVLAALSSLVSLFRKSWRRGIALFVSGAAAAAVWCSGYTRLVVDKAEAFAREQRSFSAVVTDYDRSSWDTAAVDVRLDSGTRAVLYLKKAPALEPGDRVTGTLSFAPSRSAGELYDASRGVFLCARGDTVQVVGREEHWHHDLTRFSHRLGENYRAMMPEESAGFFTALTTGYRGGLADGFKADLKMCGLYHAVSLSGMHVSVFMTLLLFLCFRRRKLAAILGFSLLLLFTLMTGASASMVRAVSMHAVLYLALFLAREYDPLTALGTALLFHLLLNPWSIANWGLQLSFLSSAGILLFLPPMVRRLWHLPMKNRLGKKLVTAVLTAVGVTLSATALSCPLMCLYFGMNSLIAPLANFLCLWAVTAGFAAGLLLSVLGLVSLPAAAALAPAAELLYKYLVWAANGLSHLPHAAVYAQTPLVLVWSYLPYLFAMLCILLRGRSWVAAVCLAVTLAAAVWGTGTLSDGVTVLDVGQGQCVVIRADGQTVMVDCGGHNAGEKAAAFLLSRNIRQLDALILTHFDDDHCNGVPVLAAGVEIKHILYPAHAPARSLKPELLALTAASAVGEVTELLGGKVTVYPAPGSDAVNECGLCVLASDGKCDMLITGDIRAKTETGLCLRNDLPDLEVLVAGHHGSSDSTGWPLLHRLKPETVLISVGPNGFGHPSPLTLRRLREIGAAVWTTQDHGNLFVGW